MYGRVVMLGKTNNIFCYIFLYHLRRIWWKELWDQVFETISSSKKGLNTCRGTEISKAFKSKALFSFSREEENLPRKNPKETVSITPQMQATNLSSNTSLRYLRYRGAYMNHHHTKTARLRRGSMVNVTTWTKESSEIYRMWEAVLSCSLHEHSTERPKESNLSPHACEICLQAFKITFLKNLKSCFHTLSKEFFKKVF